jgi:chromosome partitioning protein
VRITVGNLKGGAGKTTTAMYLAAGLSGRVAVIDAAREQESAYRWSELAGDFPAVVIPWSTPDLAKRVQAIAGDYDHLIIDTPGHSADMLRQACMVSDLLIVPLAPTPMELADLASTIDVAASIEALHPIDVRVLVVRARTGTVSAREALAWLDDDDHQIPRFDTVVRMRESYALAFGAPITDLGDYAQVLEELAHHSQEAQA